MPTPDLESSRTDRALALHQATSSKVWWFVAPIVAAALALQFASNTRVALWLVGSLLVLTFCWLKFRRLERTADNVDPSSQEQGNQEQGKIASISRTVALWSFIAGATWGLLLWVAPAQSPTGRIWFAMVLVAASASGGSQFALDRSMLLSFGFGVSLPGVSRLLIDGGSSSIAAAIVLAASLTVECRIFGRLRRSILAQHRTNERNAQLAEQLKGLNKALEYQATHDQLTGLPNRRTSIAWLAENARSKSLAVAVLDIDRFKLVNDLFGHPGGDRVLKMIGSRLRSAVHEDELVSREGGDEFCIAATKITTHAHAQMFADRILAVFNEPLTLSGRQLHLRGSLGISLAAEFPSAAPDDLMGYADIALFEAKRTRPGEMRLFDSALHSRGDVVTHEVDELCAAISRREFTPWLQPIINLRSGTMVAAECLVRWVPDTSGPVHDASTFLPLARRAGVLHQIDDLMIAGAADILTRFAHQIEPLQPGFRLNLNVPPNDSLWYFDRAKAIIGVGNFDRITFELTESELLIDPELVRSAIEEVRSYGARVVLENFGSGQSSLTLLASLPFDGLKLHRPFVQRLNAEVDPSIAEVGAAVDVANRLELAVVAEGIETPEQARTATELGIECAQGWLYGKAQPPEMIFDAAPSTPGSPG